MAAYDAGGANCVYPTAGSTRAPVGFEAACDCPDPVPILSEPVITARTSGADTEGLGVDVDAIIDVPLHWSLAAGRRNLGNALARRLAFIRSLLNAGMTDTQIGAYRAQAIAAIEADERIQRVSSLTFVLTRATSTLTISVSCDTADGPFSTVFDLQLTGSTG